MKFIFLLLMGSLSFSNPIPIAGTAASIGKRLFTIHQAHCYVAIQRYFRGENPVVIYESGEALKKTVQKMVFEEMIISEMNSFQFESGGVNEIEKKIHTNKINRQKELKEIESFCKINESKVKDQIVKTSQVEKFLQKKIETLTPVVTDLDIEKYIEQNGTLWKEKNPEKIKPTVIRMLKKEKVQEELEEWVKSLKEKYKVKLLLDE